MSQSFFFSQSENIECDFNYLDMSSLRAELDLLMNCMAGSPVRLTCPA